MSKNPNTDRPNGKAWKKKWAGKPPEPVIEHAREQSMQSKKKKEKKK